MPDGSYSTVQSVASALDAEIGAGTAGAVAARVCLRVGVNLRSPKPDQNSDPAAVQRVLACLVDMGYKL